MTFHATQLAIAFNREWSMPSAWTFRIKPIRLLLERYVGCGEGWIDPFAGDNSPAEFTNDMHPERRARWHREALEFCQAPPAQQFRGVLFDPPYSKRQIAEHYKGLGKQARALDTSGRFYSAVKDSIAPHIVDGGFAICLGWNSGGFGKKRGFALVEILLVNHGGSRNDTIATVERKLA
ncbi:MAG: hypothetical protein ABR878_13250 [Roseiarcus sp.]|jgi:hypothetical protein